MAPHSSILAWRIPGTEEPGGLPSMGSHRVGHDWSDLAVAANTKPWTILCQWKSSWSGFFTLFITYYFCLTDVYLGLLLFSRSVVSDSLWPHGVQPARLSSPGACSNSCPRVSFAIQQFHPLSPPSPPALNHSQHQELFQWVSSSHQVAKVLELQLQHQSFSILGYIPAESGQVEISPPQVLSSHLPGKPMIWWPCRTLSWAVKKILPDLLSIWGYQSSLWASLTSQLVKKLPAMQETWVRSLGW